MNATEIDFLIDTTMEFFTSPDYEFEEQGIYVKRVIVVSQTLSVGSNSRVLEAVAENEEMDIYEEGEYTSGYAKVTEDFNSSLSVVFDVFADCPPEVVFYSVVNRTLTENVGVYERYVKENSVLGEFEGTYFHVTEEFEVLESPSSLPSFTPSSSPFTQNTATDTLGMESASVALQFNGISENDNLSDEAIESFEQTTLSFLNTDEVIAWAKQIGAEPVFGLAALVAADSWGPIGRDVAAWSGEAPTVALSTRLPHVYCEL